MMQTYGSADKRPFRKGLTIAVTCAHLVRESESRGHDDIECVEAARR